MHSRSLCVLLLLCSATLLAQPLGLHDVLARPILAPRQPLVEVQAYTAANVPVLPMFSTAGQWQAYARRIREETLDKVVFRGEAARWRDADTRVEWLETIPGGPGYRIKKLRFEAVPGLWVPALLYEPEGLQGKVPVVLNVNGHARTGTATDYKQERCINLVKRGMLALNVEWFGMGQLNTPGFVHYRLNQFDLAGASGVGLFYLSMKRSIDLLLSHANADPERVAVAGLSGGGWQTIFISALDERVRLANPVAGYSSFVTRSQFPDTDLGDSEQTPSDLATVADYTHLTALRAPRPTLITHNARDTCCFRADYALAPLVRAARPAFALFDKQHHLRSHVNFDPGHNYGTDNREAFYRLLRDFFYGGSADFPVAEIPSTEELKTAEELHVELPADNTDFHKMALELSEGLPSKTDLPATRTTALEWQKAGRSRLREVVAAKDFAAEPVQAGQERQGDMEITRWRIRLDGEWTVPAVELSRGQARGTVLLLADGGRASLAGEARRFLAEGRRVVAVDPFYFGESKIEKRDFLFALLLSSLGDRPLGIQASQVGAVGSWLRQRHGDPVRVVAVGPRTSLIALIAAALHPESIAGLELHESFGSLREILESDLTARQVPELFCFGLLEAFDIKQLTALVAPRPVTFAAPTQRAKKEFAALRAYYGVLGSDFDPLTGK